MYPRKCFKMNIIDSEAKFSRWTYYISKLSPKLREQNIKRNLTAQMVINILSMPDYRAKHMDIRYRGNKK